jgi:hypothetical protein
MLGAPAKSPVTLPRGGAESRKRIITNDLGGKPQGKAYTH